MPPQNWFLKSAYQADLDLHPISILIKLPRHFSFAMDLQYAAKKPHFIRYRENKIGEQSSRC